MSPKSEVRSPKTEDRTLDHSPTPKAHSPMPIPFACPHCGTTTQVDEKFAGTSGPCAKCGSTITIPGGGAVAAKPAGGSGGMIFVILAIVGGGFLVLVAVIGILIALLLPAVHVAREAARRNQCMNNMKQIGLALDNYHHAHDSFPPAYIPDENGDPMHSWRVLILPYLEQGYLYDEYDFSQPWDSPHNLQVTDVAIPIYQCSSETLPGSTDTSYLVITGQVRCLTATRQRRSMRSRTGSRTRFYSSNLPNRPFIGPNRMTLSCRRSRSIKA